MEIRCTGPQRPVSSTPTASHVPSRAVPPLLWELTADFLDWNGMRNLLQTQRSTRQGMLDAPLSQWRRAARHHLPGQGAAGFRRRDTIWRACLRYDIAQRNIAAGTPLQEIRDTFDGEIVRASWSPDGSYLALSGGKSVRLWHATNGLTLETAHAGDIYTLAWSPDGRWCASGGLDGWLSVLDTHGGPEYRVPHVGRLYNACWSPDSTRVVAANSGTDALIVDVVNRTEVAIPHADAVPRVAWSPDGKLLTTVCSDGVARLCDGRDGTVRVQHQHRQGFFRTRDDLVDTKWSPDGKLAVNLGRQGSLSFFTPDGQVRAYEMGHYYNGVTWSPDGNRLLLQGDRGVFSTILPAPRADVATKDIEGAKHYEVLKSTEIYDQTCARWSSDAQYLLGLHRHMVRVLDVDGEEVFADKVSSIPTFCDFSASGRYVGIGTYHAGLRVWDLHTKTVREFATGAVRCATWSPDGARLAVAAWDKHIYLLDVDSPGNVPQASFPTDDASGLISWSTDGTALLFATGKSESVVLRFAPE